MNYKIVRTDRKTLAMAVRQNGELEIRAPLHTSEEHIAQFVQAHEDWARKHVAKVNMKALFVSVDRMERGTRDCSTLDELREAYGIQVFPIVTVREVISFLHNNPIDGKVYIDDDMKAKMEQYLEQYGAKV